MAICGPNFPLALVGRFGPARPARPTPVDVGSHLGLGKLDAESPRAFRRTTVAHVSDDLAEQNDDDHPYEQRYLAQLGR